MKFFSYESKFSQLLLKLGFSCYLNLLWFICSIPIFTIGASTTALYYTSLKIVRDEEYHIGATFFRSFRQNFRQSTVVWLIMLGIGLFLGTDAYIVYHLRLNATGTPAVMWTLILTVIIAVSIMYVIVLLYLFPLIASVENTNRAMFKNAFLIGTHYLFATIMLFAVRFAMFFIVVAWFTPMIIFGEGLCVLISSWMLDKLLISVSGKPDDQGESAEEGDPESENSKEVNPEDQE